MNSCTTDNTKRVIKTPTLPLRGDDRMFDKNWDRPVAPQLMSAKPMARGVANDV